MIRWIDPWMNQSNHRPIKPTNQPNKQVMCEVLGQEGWFEPYALSLLRRVLSSYKGAKALVAAADKVSFFKLLFVLYIYVYIFI